MSDTLKIAYYHQEQKAPLALTIIETHEDDGTVDLANADGDLVVARCQIVDQPQPGAATLSLPDPAAAPTEPLPKGKKKG
jgi:hypothetical protein